MSGSFDSASLWFSPSLLIIGSAGAIQTKILHIASNVCNIEYRYDTVPYMAVEDNSSVATVLVFYLAPKYFV